MEKGDHMKRACGAILLTSLVATVAVAQKSRRPSKGRQSKPAAADAERSLRELNRQWAEALKNRDTNALGLILDDQFILTDGEGHVSNKAQTIGAATGHVKIETYTLDDCHCYVVEWASLDFDMTGSSSDGLRLIRDRKSVV